ncbi:MAG: hypothetical protein M1814_000743 [Vezdaea aestivalis]|nr:MAG: hypothetical protein M1814_000743 [Vezdaea aestivalis]
MSSDSPKEQDDVDKVPAVHDKALRMRYQIGRGEQGVLTFEPYKTFLLPLWRFKTVPIARKSSQELLAAFERYGEAEDFVGMDMARKFIQMVRIIFRSLFFCLTLSWCTMGLELREFKGMTRSKRYANHAGGRKYDADTGKELAKSSSHTGAQEKLEASEVFREVWNRCRADENYLRLKSEFQKEQREYRKNSSG